MNITVLYVGSSLLAPLKNAEQEINRAHKLDLRVATHNFGSTLSDPEWQQVDRDLAEANVIFVIHVMDGENASRLIGALERYHERHDAVVVINCMPDLMRRMRLGRLDIEAIVGTKVEKGRTGEGEKGRHLLRSVGSWIGKQASQRRTNNKQRNHGQYLKL